MERTRPWRRCTTLVVALAVIAFLPEFLSAQPKSVLVQEGIAARIVAALQPETGEYAIVRYETGSAAGLETALQQALMARGVRTSLLEYGPVSDFEARLDRTDIYIWLPLSSPTGAVLEQVEALGRWLDAGRGRQIHFHWGAGTMAEDGFAGEHSPAYDSVYVDALDIDYGALDRRQSAAIATMRSAEVRVTTNAGTDVRFRVGDRPFNKQNGDASRAAMASAVTRIDREIELPAGVIRVAPLEETVHGTFVVPSARFGDTEVRDLRLEFRGGQATNISASSGESVARAALETSPALMHFREFGLGFNPKLITPSGHRWLAYYGYGAGVVRLSLGNNMEVGGAVRGEGVRWFFFPRATVTVNGTVLVEGGRLREVRSER
jgi:hypothetical protein